VQRVIEQGGLSHAGLAAQNQRRAGTAPHLLQNCLDRPAFALAPYESRTLASIEQFPNCRPIVAIPRQGNLIIAGRNTSVDGVTSADRSGNLPGSSEV
jgi:hypothetical protein